MENGRSETGKKGEDAAAQYLEGQGHRILARNWRTGHLEIDIVSEDILGIHFVEVKTRTAPVPALPEENVTPAKQKKITAAAGRFLKTMKTGWAKEIYFDVIGVVIDGEQYTITYYPQAYIPIYV
ncbi:MAG: YraN family protein [Bacteroidales bacterium]|nr:YraN family protein [Bacteroidales bacterium]